MAGNSSPIPARNAGNGLNPAILAGLTWSEKVAALGSTLPLCGPDEAEGPAALLLDLLRAGQASGGWLSPRRGRQQLRRLAARAMVIQWPHLSISLRERIVAELCADVAEAAWTCAQTPSTRVAAVRFAADLGTPDMARLIASAADTSEPGLAAIADQALLGLCQHVAGGTFDEPGHTFSPPLTRCVWLPSDVAALHNTVAELCSTFADHRRRAAVIAAVVLLDRAALAYAEEPLARWLLDERQPSHPTVRSLLRRGEGALTRRRAWEWLSRPVVAAAAMERLSRAATVHEHEAVLGDGHLIENPSRSERWRLLSTSRSPGQCLPEPEEVQSLSPGAKRGMVRILRDAMDPDQTRNRLASLLTEPDAIVKLCAVDALAPADTLDYSFDPDERVAVAAAIKWLHGAPADPAEKRRVTSNWCRSPHTRVRSLAEDGRETASTPRASARASNRPLLDQLRAQIASGEPDERFFAIMSARRLEVQRGIELELLGLLGASDGEGSADERVVAAAVSALGEAGTPSAIEAVSVCLNHALPRVRANATEALAERALGRGDLPLAQPRLYESLIEMKGDSHHRVRSTALRAIVRAASPDWGGTGYEPVAADELVHMLEDPRPMHRLAALWAVAHAVAAGGESIHRRWDRLAAIVAHLARSEPDDAVQRRALWCARRMLVSEPCRFGELRAAVEECAA